MPYIDVYAHREPSAEFLRMKRIYYDCTGANIPIPTEVLEFFGHETPSDTEESVLVVTVDDSGELRENQVGATEFREDMSNGARFDFDRLPEGTTALTVTINY